MQKKRTLQYIVANGNKWLPVSIKDIKTLGIAEKISTHSYISMSKVLLLDNGDIGLYLFKANQLWDLHFKAPKQQTQSPVRKMLPYDPYWIMYPLTIGSKVISNNGLLEIVNMDDPIIMKGKNGIFKSKKSDLFDYIKPPTHLLNT